MLSFVPAPTGTRFRIVRFPSGLEITRLIEEGFDAAAFRQEYRSKIPGLAETHELDDPGMHTTDTIDYGIVLSGEILRWNWMTAKKYTSGQAIASYRTERDMGGGIEARKTCLVAFIMIGARRK